MYSTAKSHDRQRATFKAAAAALTKPAVVKLSAKAIKTTIALDPKMIGKIDLPLNAPAPPMQIEVGGRVFRVQLNTKGLRRVLATIAENGPEQVVVILQGKLEDNNTITEVGIVAQVKDKPRENGVL